MNEPFPIIPPPELVQQWVAEIWHEGTPVQVSLSDEHIATRAAQWGADQELEACIEWLLQKQIFSKDGLYLTKLLAARRPSLKEQALASLAELESPGRCDEPGYESLCNTIRRALEALPND